MRLLIVAHFFPPSTETGANRPAALSEHLRAQGHEVTVLTSSAYGRLPGDREQGVERTRDLQLLQPHARRRGGGFSDASYSTRPHPIARVMVPDPYLLAWLPFARARARELQRARGFDCAITTSPPESSHWVGWALTPRGVAWVADLRDGWAFEPHVQERLWPTAAQLRLNERLERRLLRRADAVTAVTEPVAEDLRERVGVQATVIPNGWDPPEAAPAARGAADQQGGGGEPPELDPERVSLVFTGRLAAGNKDPGPFIRALAELAREQPDAAGRLEVAFAGSFTEEELRLFDADVRPARIVVAGNLGRRAVTQLQRSADAGLLITAATRRQESGSKLFEYIGAGLPIIALARADSAAAEIVTAANGVVVGTDDVAGAKAALSSLAAGTIPPPSEELRRAYAWPELAQRMAEVAEEAIELRRARGAQPSARR